jgi:hypothetical protein
MVFQVSNVYHFMHDAVPARWFGDANCIASDNKSHSSDILRVETESTAKSAHKCNDHERISVQESCSLVDTKGRRCACSGCSART